MCPFACGFQAARQARSRFIAINLLEYWGDRAPAYKIQIFATDIDEQALAVARNATYRQSIEIDVSPERLHRFFTAADVGYQLERAPGVVVNEKLDIIQFRRRTSRFLEPTPGSASLNILNGMLEASKEELQSTNEELATLNEELQNRMAQLAVSNDDLQYAADRAASRSCASSGPTRRS